MRDDAIEKAALLLMGSIQRMITEPRDAAAFAVHAAEHLSALAHAVANEAAQKAFDKLREERERSGS